LSLSGVRPVAIQAASYRFLPTKPEKPVTSGGGACTIQENGRLLSRERVNMKARLFLLAAFSFLPVCSGETVVPLIAGPAVLPAFSRHLLGDDREQASSIYSEHFCFS